MLYHLRPRIYITTADTASVLSFSSEELGIHLGSDDLKTGHPVNNRRYHVACRSGGRTVDGILVETREPVAKFSTTTVWRLHGEHDGVTLTHVVNYSLLDTLHDAASDNMVLWYGQEIDGQEMRPRWPRWARGMAPVAVEPVMFPVPTDTGKPEGMMRVQIGENGLVLLQEEDFPMHTIERERLTSPGNARVEKIPAVDQAFLSRADA